MELIELADRVIIEPGTKADSAIVWMHGLGADGYDFVPIVRELDLPRDLAMRFVFPHAPVRPVTLNGGMPMPAWYDIIAIGANAPEDVSGISRSQRTINGLIDEQIAQGIAPARILLAGFSQGGAMALYTGLRYGQALAGILALSTYLPLADVLENEIAPAQRHTPVLMLHGDEDSVVPVGLGQASMAILRALGLSVAWQTYPMAHSVCDTELVRISEFIHARLG